MGSVDFVGVLGEMEEKLRLWETNDTAYVLCCP